MGIFAVMASWEIFAPRRILMTDKARRWYSNLSLAFLDTLALRIVLPVQAVGIAEIAQHRGWGLLNRLSFPDSLEIVPQFSSSNRSTASVGTQSAGAEHCGAHTG